MQNNKKMFSMQTSRSSPSALPLPMRICCPQPAHHLPRTRRGGLNSTERRMSWQSLTMYRLLYPLLTLAALPQLLILVSAKAARGRMPATLCKAPMETETRVKDEGEVCSSSEQLSCVFPSPSHSQGAQTHCLGTARLLPEQQIPHFCTKISAAENCFFQEGQAAPSMQAQKGHLARQASSSPLKQRNTAEGFSSFEPGMSDSQSSLLCSPVHEFPEELSHCSRLPEDLAHIV